MTPHPEIAEIAFLLGEWRGSGSGDYPTIESFEYDETVNFGHVGKPFIAYSQRTRRKDTDEPLHSETGYFRPAGPGGVELVLAQPSGIVEIHSGSVDNGRLRLKSVMVGLTETAKEVSTVERILDIEGDTMVYELWMEAVGQPHQFHLRAELRRQ